MTFEQWQATRKEVASIDAELGTTCGEGPGYVYDGGCFIEFVPHIHNGKSTRWYQVTCENFSEFDGDLAKMERVLWDAWAKDEVGG